GPFVYVYVSKYKNLVQETSQIEKEMFIDRNFSRFHRFSELMGYPKCCYNFFARNIYKNRRDSHRMEYLIYKKTKGRPSFYLNNLIRGDYYLISHHPCSYNCEESIKYAKKVFAGIKTIDQKLSEKIIKLLKFPVLKFIKRGHYLRLLGGVVQKSQFVHYKACEGGNNLTKKFQRGNKILICNNRIEIFKGDRKIDVYNKKNKLDGVIFNF
ncbi:MAG: hypothetical protein PHW43_11885, partial [Syntrophales bacterium]|nr:hypothetical protein [Syntrophales bacterium]